MQNFSGVFSQSHFETFFKLLSIRKLIFFLSFISASNFCATSFLLPKVNRIFFIFSLCLYFFLFFLVSSFGDVVFKVQTDLVTSDKASSIFKTFGTLKLF